MKRMIPLMLIVAMLLSMSLSAAATEAGSTSVKAGYAAGEESGQIISVDIEWEGMEFTYNGASDDTWDPEAHQYIKGHAAGWAESAASISITNHSDTILQADIQYTSETGFEDMELEFADDKPYIGSANTGIDGGAGAACQVIVRTIPMGELAPNTQTGTKVGEIKVTVTPVDNHMTVLGSLEGAAGEIPVKSDTLARGSICFETAQDMTDADTYFQEALEAALKQDPDSTPAKNLALNKFLTAYYNKLYLKQDQQTN